MGEGKRPFFEPTFNRSIKVQGGDDRLTSDASFLVLREADHRLGLIDSLAQELRDPRQQRLVRHTMPELLRERIYGMAWGQRWPGSPTRNRPSSSRCSCGPQRIEQHTLAFAMAGWPQVRQFRP